MTQSWYNEARVRQPGSVVLNAWREQRQAERAKAQVKPVPVSDIRSGTDAFGWLTGGVGGSGRPVSERTAMSIGAVYACVSLLGGVLASLTLETYKLVDGIGEAHRPDLWWMLNEEMHPRWAAPVGWEFGAQSLLLHGDLFMRIGRQADTRQTSFRSSLTTRYRLIRSRVPTGSGSSITCGMRTATSRWSTRTT